MYTKHRHPPYPPRFPEDMNESTTNTNTSSEQSCFLDGMRGAFYTPSTASSASGYAAAAGESYDRRYVSGQRDNDDDRYHRRSRYEDSVVSSDTSASTTYSPYNVDRHRLQTHRFVQFASHRHFLPADMDPPSTTEDCSCVSSESSMTGEECSDSACSCHVREYCPVCEAEKERMYRDQYGDDETTSSTWCSCSACEEKRRQAVDDSEDRGSTCSSAAAFSSLPDSNCSCSVCSEKRHRRSTARHQKKSSDNTKKSPHKIVGGYVDDDSVSHDATPPARAKDLLVDAPQLLMFTKHIDDRDGDEGRGVPLAKDVEKQGAIKKDGESEAPPAGKPSLEKEQDSKKEEEAETQTAKPAPTKALKEKIGSKDVEKNEKMAPQKEEERTNKKSKASNFASSQSSSTGDDDDLVVSAVPPPPLQFPPRSAQKKNKQKKGLKENDDDAEEKSIDSIEFCGRKNASVGTRTLPFLVSKNPSTTSTATGKEPQQYHDDNHEEEASLCSYIQEGALHWAPQNLLQLKSVLDEFVVVEEEEEEEVRKVEQCDNKPLLGVDDVTTTNNKKEVAGDTNIDSTSASPQEEKVKEKPNPKNTKKNTRLVVKQLHHHDGGDSLSLPLGSGSRVHKKMKSIEIQVDGDEIDDEIIDMIQAEIEAKNAAKQSGGDGEKVGEGDAGQSPMVSNPTAKAWALLLAEKTARQQPGAQQTDGATEGEQRATGRIPFASALSPLQLAVSGASSSFTPSPHSNMKASAAVSRLALAAEIANLNREVERLMGREEELLTKLMVKDREVEEKLDSAKKAAAKDTKHLLQQQMKKLEDLEEFSRASLADVAASWVTTPAECTYPLALESLQLRLEAAQRETAERDRHQNLLKNVADWQVQQSGAKELRNLENREAIDRSGVESSWSNACVELQRVADEHTVSVAQQRANESATREKQALEKIAVLEATLSQQKVVEGELRGKLLRALSLSAETSASSKNGGAEGRQGVLLVSGSTAAAAPPSSGVLADVNHKLPIHERFRRAHAIVYNNNNK